MLIVLEGPDGAGKSYLGRQLEVVLKGKYVPSPKLESQQQFDEVTEDQEYYANSSRIYIMDRVTWISELIYSSVLPNRPCRLDLNKIHYYFALSQVVVHCCPTDINKKDISQEFKEHKSKEHLEAVMKQHTRIIDRYETFFEKQSKCFSGYFKYDWKKQYAYPALINYLKDKI